MKRTISSLIIVLLVLSLVGPVSAEPNSSIQMTSDEMVQITGGRVACGGYTSRYCCCFSLWIFDICICV